MFEKNLQSLVKGIRSASKSGEPVTFISSCLAEIKAELKSTDPFLKAEAVRKLTYLNMVGYDMSWAAFHIVEVMSFERFSQKRIGYLAASQSFTTSTDVVLLCTNLLKKEFGSLSEFEVGLAINCLANIANLDLARDLLGDIVHMMLSPKPYVRKKAVLVLYKVFLQYPQGLRLTFDKLKERMEETDVSVVSCSVNVICELANKKPKNYLGLAPTFFRLLTTSSNNWMLIKVVKLMASLVPEEPRLARKLLDPLATIIQNTPAKSLLYECIGTVTVALLYTRKSDGGQPRNVPAVVRLCNEHLRRFVQDQDQNLRYLGLVGLSNLMKSHPNIINEHEAIILECLSCDDVTIRLRCLELLSGIAKIDNTPKIISKLLYYTQNADADSTYQNQVIKKILHICSRNKYQNVDDFKWYVNILVKLALLPGNVSNGHGEEISNQLIDIAVRVGTARKFIVEEMISLLLDKNTLNGPSGSTIAQVLYGAAWIAGEFGTFLFESDNESDSESESDNSVDSDDEGHGKKRKCTVDFVLLVDEMLQPSTTTLSPAVQAVFMQTLLKIIYIVAKSSHFTSENTMGTIQQISVLIISRLPAFAQSEHIEVQERASSLREVLLGLGLGWDCLSSSERSSRAFDSNHNGGHTEMSVDELESYLSKFFEPKMAPVGSKAQSKVPLPDGLDLDIAINPAETKFLTTFSSDKSSSKLLRQKSSSDDIFNINFVSSGGNGNNAFLEMEQDTSASNYQTGIQESSYLQNLERKEEYNKKNSMTSEQQYEMDLEKLRQDPFYLKQNLSSPVDVVDDSLNGDIGLNKSKKQRKKDKKERKKKKRAVLIDEVMVHIHPDGVSSGDEDMSSRRMKRTSHKKIVGDDLAEIDLSVPLAENEKIPDDHLFHRKVEEVVEDVDKSSSKKHKSHRKGGKRKDVVEKKKKKPSSSSRKSSLVEEQDEIEEEGEKEEEVVKKSKKSKKKSSMKIEKKPKKKKKKKSTTTKKTDEDELLLIF